MFLEAVRGVVRRNHELGFSPKFDPAWEKDSFVAGHSVYIRPFTTPKAGSG
jgi:branched-chain amino acid aminotransferase